MPTGSPRRAILAAIVFQVLVFLFLLYRSTESTMSKLTRAYEIVPGYFLQDDPNADPDLIGPTPPFFGLNSQSWSNFTTSIAELSAKDTTATSSYKVIFLGRHGEGYHNVAAAKYGEEAWDAKWSLLEGDGEITWGPDPNLTPLGEGQVRNANTAWRLELPHGIPLPEKYYISPMKRAIHTYQLTFDGILLEPHPVPVIIENCREEYGEHTCDKRRTRSEIHAEFPLYEFEEGFTEEDNLWTWTRERKAHVDERAKHMLDRIWEQDADNIYISITAHSGIIHGFLRVIGRGVYNIATGGIMVIVVKGTVVQPALKN